MNTTLNMQDWLTELNANPKCCPPAEFFDGEETYYKNWERKFHYQEFVNRAEELSTAIARKDVADITAQVDIKFKTSNQLKTFIVSNEEHIDMCEFSLELYQSVFKCKKGTTWDIAGNDDVDIKKTVKKEILREFVIELINIHINKLKEENEYITVEDTIYLMC